MTRIVTKQTSKLDISYEQSDEYHHRYYYHPDHLGSAQLVTDYEGNEYQRIEYTPYGELWVEKKSENEMEFRSEPFSTSFATQNSGSNRKVAAFTAKEQDEARTIAGVSCVGLYYYGAQYLDAKYSRWLSTDPAVGEYIPQAPVSDKAKKHNQSLPGMGGIFNGERKYRRKSTGSCPSSYLAG
ncbi:hypothetical protein HRI96_11590 [Treponema parvum]|uniref:RHS repeat-associated core domain-containing protein n=1 Tax=Treponema parvum TaxID=138851 RepID=A0A975F1N1_9SPIR|nr:hypothetical protein [Treponema parvum]QTQ12782.1 hypothetical protein HRI96_11590 [Treponema parvum]QTQ15239.1 hypothetical protein HXT04_00135 [Treponema parvum]